MKILFTALFMSCTIFVFSADNKTADAKNAVEAESFNLMAIDNMLAIESEKPVDINRPFNHFGVGLRVSTVGVGVEGITSLNRFFQLRAGFSFFSMSDDWNIGVDDERISRAIEGNFQPEYRVHGKIRFSNAHALVDINPFGFGIFHFTTGVFLGNNKLAAGGFLINPETGERAKLREGIVDFPPLVIDGRELIIERDASLDGALYLGNVVKPYLGIGLGRSLPKKRLGFMFELGALYQGDWIIKQNGHEVNISTSSNFESLRDVNDFKRLVRWWPMLNFQLTYRIF